MSSLLRVGMTLYSANGSRKYLNATEHRRFIDAARCAPPQVGVFCLMLRWSGGRISEVLALTPASIDVESGVACMETLKRRRHWIRQVPLPRDLLEELDRVFRLGALQGDPQLAAARIWRWSRTTAWRRVKEVMAQANITGSSAMPRGLRHSFGVNAFQAGVPSHLVQRWLGHASLRTTSIYGDVMGPDERAFATRMWSK